MHHRYDTAYFIIIVHDDPRKKTAKVARRVVLRRGRATESHLTAEDVQTLCDGDGKVEGDMTEDRIPVDPALSRVI